MRAEPVVRRAGAATAVAALLLGISGCAVKPTPAPPSPWADTLQACGIRQDALAAAWPAPGPGFCQRADLLGLQLDCLARVLPTSAAALSQFSVAGLLDFQACLQPLAAGLLAGRAGRPEDMDLALRHCVQQLDLSPAGPRVPPPWWRVLGHTGPAAGVHHTPADTSDARPVDTPPTPPVGLRLRPSAGLSWPACADTAAMQPAAPPVGRPVRPPGGAGVESDRAIHSNPRTP